MKYYIYDIETFPNIFTCVIKNAQTKELRIFELSSRKNELKKLIKTLDWLSQNQKVLVGYNNLNFDYALLQYLYKKAPLFKNIKEFIYEIYLFANKLINSNQNYFEDKTSINLTQIDLMKVHNFDYKTKMVSLKVLEINMRMQSIEDMPFEVGKKLEESSFDELIAYNISDVEATYEFFLLSKDEIEFREELSLKYEEDMLNYSDMKIGKRYFIRNLEERLGKEICFKDGKPRQTIRNHIDFSKVIFEHMKFKSKEFNSLLRYLKKQYTNDMSKVFSNISKESLAELSDFLILNKNRANNLHIIFKDFLFNFGTGGLHGSDENGYFESDEKHIIIDVDVASYYPSIVVQNRLYPKHLGVEFADIYNEIKELRFSYDKKSAQNKMLKLALNAAGFGDTNNKFSPFYDYMMTITITLNGQLMLCMLAEALFIEIDSMKMIQANTDGLTFIFEKSERKKFEEILQWWQGLTGMILEQSIYKKLWIRDVNNYIALKNDGGVKKIGAYKDDLLWNQNHSSLLVQKAVEAFLIDGVDVKEFILNHKDSFDFMLNYRANRTISLVLESKKGLKKEYEKLPNTIRYYISKNGKSLKKLLPPLKEGSEFRVIGLNVGFLVKICNNADSFTFEDLDYDWYIKEAYKLINPFFKEKKSLFDFEY